jgi:NADPH:quinone reductase-like Zn-dependent oxidoreductase
MVHSEQKVAWLSEKGGAYHIDHREVPRPGPGSVLVKIESCALNPVDEYSRLTGIFVDKYPYIGGNDGSGIVEEVGEGVSELIVGDKVCVLCHLLTLDVSCSTKDGHSFFQGRFGDHRGTFQEYVLVDVPLIAKVSLFVVRMQHVDFTYHWENC